MQIVLPSCSKLRRFAGTRSRGKAACSCRTRKLRPRNTVSLKSGYERIIRCVSGSLWITSDADAGDVILQAGGTFVAAGNSKVVVEALEESVAEFGE